MTSSELKQLTQTTLISQYERSAELHYSAYFSANDSSTAEFHETEYWEYCDLISGIASMSKGDFARWKYAAFKAEPTQLSLF